MKKIILTGGGTSGHVTPNIALLEKLSKKYEVHYIGTNDGIEKQLMSQEDVIYHTVKAGKLRRYFSLKNFSDLFKILGGFIKSVVLIRKIKPSAVFSKGGFVTCPVVWGAWINQVPVILHESDYTPGLANKLAMPFAKNICYSFPETERYLPKEKSIMTGLPVRNLLEAGNKEAGLKYCGFNNEKPVIAVFGGSTGSVFINETIRSLLDELLKTFQICHVCGKDKLDRDFDNIQGYKQFEYIDNELKDVYGMADVLIVRGGATTLFELLMLKKPHIIIPLSRKASRGDQILNAKSFGTQGFSQSIEEEEITKEKILELIEMTYGNRQKYIGAMESAECTNAVDKVIEVIESNMK